MIYYNIHTHLANQDSSYAILNTYPTNYKNIIDTNCSEYYSCGVHPWYAKEGLAQINFLTQIANDTRLVAIGEAGLDKLRGSEFEIQRRVFEIQIQLSALVNKPLIIHCVKAWSELLALHKQYKPKQAWIIHGFRGNPDLAQQLINKGLYLSIGENFQNKTLPHIPLNRLFCETDASAVSITSVYKTVSLELNIPLHDLTVQLTENFEQVFLS